MKEEWKSSFNTRASCHPSSQPAPSADTSWAAWQPCPLPTSGSVSVGGGVPRVVSWHWHLQSLNRDSPCTASVRSAKAGFSWRFPTMRRMRFSLWLFSQLLSRGLSKQYCFASLGGKRAVEHAEGLEVLWPNWTGFLSEMPFSSILQPFRCSGMLQFWLSRSRTLMVNWMSSVYRTFFVIKGELLEKLIWNI